MRKRKAEGTDDRQSCCMDGHRQDSVSDLGSQGQSRLERHDCQRLRAGHLRRRRMILSRKEICSTLVANFQFDTI